MAQGIRERGKAEPGERTMVDAWAPAAQAAEAALDWNEPLAAVPAAAQDGAEATKGDAGRQGARRGWASAASATWIRGGASAALIVQTMADILA